MTADEWAGWGLVALSALWVVGWLILVAGGGIHRGPWWWER